jgi:signal transduction histidine kinase
MAGRLERTMIAQREFVANASHQLRTPLTGMKLRLGNAQALTDDPAVRTELVAAESEVDRLAGIVERLLVMAREIEEGQATHVDLADAVARGLERWRDRSVRAGASVSSTGGTVFALASPADIDQVLDVVVDNAVSYAPGPIEVRTAREGTRAILVVQDHGDGIAADQLDRVSERFYRGSNASPGGTGLGLAIAKELIERWGGMITVTSPDDGGTRVEIVLRAVDV